MADKQVSSRNAGNNTPGVDSHKGHRDRLRDRFLVGGPDALPDYELLELLLFQAIPRRDTKPLARQLLNRFGSIPAILAASPTMLMTECELSKSVTVALKSAHAIAVRSIRAEVFRRPILNSWSRLIDYLQMSMAHEKQEQFRLLFLNKRNELIHDEVQSRGTIDHTAVYPREVVKLCVSHGATALILVHNHPSGDPSPSQADIDMTQQLIAAITPIGVVLHDHLIISTSGHASFKSLGLL